MKYLTKATQFSRSLSHLGALVMPYFWVKILPPGAVTLRGFISRYACMKASASARVAMPPDFSSPFAARELESSSQMLVGAEAKLLASGLRAIASESLPQMLPGST